MDEVSCLPDLAAKTPRPTHYVRTAAEASVAARRARRLNTFIDPISLEEVPERHSVELNRKTYDPRSLLTWANARGTVPHSRRPMTEDEKEHARCMARLAEGYEGYGTLDFDDDQHDLVGFVMKSTRNGFKAWSRLNGAQSTFSNRKTYGGIELELLGFKFPDETQLAVFHNNKPVVTLDHVPGNPRYDRVEVIVYYAHTFEQQQVFIGLAKALAKSLGTTLKYRDGRE